MRFVEKRTKNISRKLIFLEHYNSVGMLFVDSIASDSLLFIENLNSNANFAVDKPFFIVNE